MVVFVGVSVSFFHIFPLGWDKRCCHAIPNGTKCHLALSPFSFVIEERSKLTIKLAKYPVVSYHFKIIIYESNLFRNKSKSINQISNDMALQKFP